MALHWKVLPLSDGSMNRRPDMAYLPQAGLPITPPVRHDRPDPSVHIPVFPSYRLRLPQGIVSVLPLLRFAVPSDLSVLL